MTLLSRAKQQTLVKFIIDEAPLSFKVEKIKSDIYTSNYNLGPKVSGSVGAVSVWPVDLKVNGESTIEKVEIAHGFNSMEYVSISNYDSGFVVSQQGWSKIRITRKNGVVHEEYIYINDKHEETLPFVTYNAQSVYNNTIEIVPTSSNIESFWIEFDGKVVENFTVSGLYTVKMKSYSGIITASDVQIHNETPTLHTKVPRYTNGDVVVSFESALSVNEGTLYVTAEYRDEINQQWVTIYSGYRFTGSGTYIIRLSDSAGNISLYSFHIAKEFMGSEVKVEESGINIETSNLKSVAVLKGDEYINGWENTETEPQRLGLRNATKPSTFIQLEDSGDYTLVLTDLAGNIEQKEVKIGTNIVDNIVEPVLPIIDEESSSGGINLGLFFGIWGIIGASVVVFLFRRSVKKKDDITKWTN